MANPYEALGAGFQTVAVVSPFERSSPWNGSRVASRRDDPWAPGLPVERAAGDRRLTVPGADADNRTIRNLRSQRGPETKRRSRASTHESDRGRQFERMKSKHRPGPRGRAGK